MKVIMRTIYIALMNRLYAFCVWLCVLSIIVMTVLIAVGVFSRYVLGIGAFYAEPISIFLAIQLSFYGAAACYRANAHLSLDFVVKQLPPAGQLAMSYLVHVLMAGFAAFMVYYGSNLVATTFFQTYPEFQYIRVGLVYTAIPLAGLITLLFVIEKVMSSGASTAFNLGANLGEHN